jgi:hypothetical protein
MAKRKSTKGQTTIINKSLSSNHHFNVGKAYTKQLSTQETVAPRKRKMTTVAVNLNRVGIAVYEKINDF